MVVPHDVFLLRMGDLLRWLDYFQVSMSPGIAELRQQERANHALPHIRSPNTTPNNPKLYYYGIPPFHLTILGMGQCPHGSLAWGSWGV